MIPVLSITGSDSTGGAGVQADIRTISAMGGYAMSVITSIAVQNSGGIHSVHEVPCGIVMGQLYSIFDDITPKAVKVGLINDVETMRNIRKEIIGCKSIVCDPGLVSSHGICLMSHEAIEAFRRFLLPESSLLVLRCDEAEILLDMKICSTEDMLRAAKELVSDGAKWVMLRGGNLDDNRLTALVYGEGSHKFYTTYNIEGWQRHGVGGALSTAIATRLAFGDDMVTAIRNAHDYIHSQVVYNVSSETRNPRLAELYNEFLSLIADNYSQAHDVAYYADKLAITTRYLSQVTRAMVDKSPKQIIDDYLLQEIDILLSSTSLTIQEISDKLGFSSQVLLSKFYRSKKGMAPKEFRNH